MKNLKFSFFGFFVFFALAILISSCAKEEITDLEEVNSNNDRIIKYIESMGFDKEEITIEDDIVTFDEINWSKRQILSFLNEEHQLDNTIDCQDELGCEEMEQEMDINDIDARQRSLSRHLIVRQNLVTNIKFHIDPTVLIHCGQPWVDAINQAISEWNEIANGRVVFSATNQSGLADVQITSGFPRGAVAKGSFPVGGRVGNKVTIHRHQDNFSRKKVVMMHEIAHNLGFTHTDGSFGGYLHGTSVDPFSIFTSGPNNINTTAEFTAHDLRAIRLLYPDQLRKPSFFSVEKVTAGKVRVRYRNMEKALKPFYWIRVLKYDNNGRLLAVKDVKSDSLADGVDTVVWGGHTPNTTYKFAVRGLNFKKDVHSGRTIKKAIAL